MYTALISGLISQQLANEPGGRRWRRLIPRVMTMFADDIGLPSHPAEPLRIELIMEPRTSKLDRSTAMALAATEYDRCAALLRSLQPEDWGKPTACPAWDVRQLAAHMLGMVEMAASLP